MKVGFDRCFAEKICTITWKKGIAAKIATTAATNAIVLDRDLSSQIK